MKCLLVSIGAPQRSGLLREGVLMGQTIGLRFSND